MTSVTHPIDELDRRILALFAAEPRLGVLEASRRLRVARGTVQARLERMQSNGVITDWAPTVSPQALGYRVTAFVTCEIDQGAGRRRVAEHLESIPEVLECWTITGDGDLWVRVVARSNADVQRVIDQMHTDAGVLRTSTLIGLEREFGHRTGPLVQHTGKD
ncbi:Lrp/AsnC family transcriptional regulator [Enemella evansiae]|uniref:Lrp/AsnC family transcriptional regulator n=1 Tax=Enemella evansiae TaxID=2016499 RepID=UPI000C01A7C5|nr:Lrp/AsnC family transcriptional regulator [Enemella evansiae]PFG66338.1 transcriptional regulator, AsnC family [Propionibacteriaceae bacterium ES.041]TDO88069.1 AsnC family transcriptional regulator [Enemella evansiae]